MELESVMDVFAQKAEAQSKEHPEDYIGEDGLKRCGVCHGKKQHRGICLGKEIVVSCICQCRVKELEEEERRAEEAKRQSLISSNRRTGFPESDMQYWTFDNDDGAHPGIMRAMKIYVDNFPQLSREGKGLLLYGGVGTGKTFAAACVVNALIDSGYSCLMTNFSRVLNTLWGTEQRQDYLDKLNSFRLLVLDDLGAERRSEHAQEQVFNVIDARYRAKLPMIITTNLTAEELKNPKDITNRRIYDRILEMCHPIAVNGVNRRRKKLTEGFTDMNKLFELE